MKKVTPVPSKAGRASEVQRGQGQLHSWEPSFVRELVWGPLSSQPAGTWMGPGQKVWVVELRIQSPVTRG